MLYLFYGSDARRLADKANVFIDVLRKRKPDAPFFIFDRDTVDTVRLEEMESAAGLFETHNIVVLDECLGTPEVSSWIKNAFPRVKDSRTVFVFREKAVSKTLEKQFEKYAERIWRCDVRIIQKKRSMDIFRLADALGKRNRREAWIELTKAFRRGDKAEEIHGTLFWQVKTLLSVKKAETKGMSAVRQLKLNPFVEKKSRGFAKNYTEKDLEVISRRLVRMYHKARAGGEELEIGLERFVLML